jgi:hypothetical protein
MCQRHPEGKAHVSDGRATFSVHGAMTEPDWPDKGPAPERLIK